MINKNGQQPGLHVWIIRELLELIFHRSTTNKQTNSKICERHNLFGHFVRLHSELASRRENDCSNADLRVHVNLMNN